MRDQRTRMQTIVDQAPMSVLLADCDGRYVVANRASAEQIGLPVEEIVGHLPAELYEPAVAAEIDRDTRRILAGAGPTTFEVTRANARGSPPGEARDYLVTMYPSLDAGGRITGVGTNSLDITTRKRAEADAARMAEIITSTDAAVVGMGLDGEILSWNPAAELIYGYTAQEAIGRNVSLLIPPERLGEVSVNKSRINTGHAVGEIETLRRRKDGTDIDVAIALSPLLDAHGEVIGASTIARDITAQKAMREQLRASEERLRATIDHAPIGIALLAPDGRTLRVNRALCEMLGHEESALLAETPPAITHPDEAGIEAALTARLLAGEIPSYDLETRYLRADGSVLFAQLSVSVARDAEGAPMHLVAQVQDISRRRDDEARLLMQAREQEALTEVATLVASEAHVRAVFAAAATRVAGLFDADFGIVVRLDTDERARIVGAWSADPLATPRPGATVALEGRGDNGTAVRARRAGLLVSDALAAGTKTAVEHVLSAPIEVNGRFWGAVGVGWEREPASDPQAADRLSRFARLVSLAVTGADAREQLSKLASTDHLTGLLNRRAFSDRLEHDVARARRHDRPLSLAVFDVDHFKSINDTFGHPTGDRVLGDFAERLMAGRRAGDVIARIGGEEFALIMADTDGAGAELCAERNRLAIGEHAFPGVGTLTTSIGICALDHASDAQELLRNADRALYWAKASGRNATIRYTPEMAARMGSPGDAAWFG